MGSLLQLLLYSNVGIHNKGIIKDAKSKHWAGIMPQKDQLLSALALYPTQLQENCISADTNHLPISQFAALQTSR